MQRITNLRRAIFSTCKHGNCVIHSYVASKRHAASIFSKAMNQTATDRRLEGKVAVVTGGASGIGEATCRLFTAQGAKVVIADIQDDAGRRVQEELGAMASYRHCDVSKESDVASLLDFAKAQHGAVHVMFNNAGITDGGHVSVAHLSMEEFTRVMDVNVKGVVHGVKHAARVMQAGGSIICTGSVSSVVAMGNNHAYTIAKHAVVGIVKTAALELGGVGVRVNAVSPWVVPTPLVMQALQQCGSGATMDEVASLAQRPTNIPLQEVAGLRVHDVAQAVLFLASEESRFISGHNLLLDGAFTSCRQLFFS